MGECCNENVTLVTGAALHNLGAALKFYGFKLGRWVAQGGFAGEGVVPRELQMDKFLGKEVCPTWNFGGNEKAAGEALRSPCIGRRILVSKNVCHKVVYDTAWHEALKTAVAKASAMPKRAHALNVMYKAMDSYLRHHPGGKKLHDPLALAAAFDESVCTYAEVMMYCQKGHWGAYLCPGSETWISIDYCAEKFQKVLLYATPLAPWGSDVCKGSESNVAESMPTTKTTANAGKSESSTESKLSNDEKLVLRLASKLREIIKLEKRAADGEPLQSTQLTKVAGKADNAAALKDVVCALHPSSDVHEKIKDVLSALET